MRKVLLTWLLTALLATPGYCIAAEAPDPALLELVRIGCRESTSAIVSGKGRVVVKNRQIRRGGAVAEDETTYDVAYTSDRCRMAVERKIVRNDPLPGNDPERSFRVGSVIHKDIAAIGDRITQLENGVAYVGQRGVHKRANLAYNAHIRHIARVGRMVPGNGILDVDALAFSGPGAAFWTVEGIVRDTGSGDDRIRVEMAHRAEGRAQYLILWVDPSRGFCVPRVQVFAEGDGFAARTLTQESEASMRGYGGVWFPEKVVQNYYALDKEGAPYNSRSVITTYAPDFRVNVQVGEEDLSLVLPSGTKVNDEALAASYVIR